MKKNISVYTNIPTPYQNDFSIAMSKHFNVRVVYYSNTERNRDWNNNYLNNIAYEAIYLNNSWLSLKLQNIIKDFHFSWSIFKICIYEKSDYIILSGGYWHPNTIIAALLLKIKGKKIAFWGERVKIKKYTVKYFLKFLFLMPIKIACVRIIGIGKEAVDSYKMLGFKVPISNIPYCINMEDYINSNRKHNISPIFLFCGSLVHRKGVDTIIDAFKSISKKKYPDIKLIIIGDGDDKTYLHSLAIEDNRIEFAGFKQPDSIKNYYNNSDIFLFASRYDGWGVVINEAIASGLAIITTNEVGAAKEWIIDSINGYLCNPDDPLEWRNRILDMIDNPLIVKKFSKYNESFRQYTDAKYFSNKLAVLLKYDLNL